jgi:uncharacterized protein YgbK (DUF1537 family)
MIIAIADDITGAAELGGIAIRYNLKVIVSDDVQKVNQVDVLVIYTNTRSMRRGEAIETMRKLTAKAKDLHPALFYKKTDSVLRGHVAAEMKAQMHVMGFNKALLVPINPSSGRVIRDGYYYIKDSLVHETGFSADPEFPIRSSRVDEMLGKERVPVKLIRTHEELMANTISIGEAETEEDLANWARHHDGTVLLAGGGSFFNALLYDTLQIKREYKKAEVQLMEPLCFVSGTAYRRNVERIKEYDPVVSYMPSDVFSGNEIEDFNYQSWLDEALAILWKYNKVIIAIGDKHKAQGNPKLLSNKLAEIVMLLFSWVNISELIIEGGSTAYSIIRELGWHSFIPTEELAQGIVRMSIVGDRELHLTIKPGSYDWPRQWVFN